MSGKMTQKPKLKAAFIAATFCLTFYLAATSTVLAQRSAVDRLDALELRLAQLQQNFEAQNRLAIRGEMTQFKQLSDRLTVLEKQLLDVMGSINNLPNNNASTNASTNSEANLSTSGFNQSQDVPLQEALRTLRGQTETLVIRYDALVTQIETANADNEFRFQQLESAYRRATQGVSSASAEPQIIGRIKKQMPVEGAAALRNSRLSDKLIGEGDMPDAAGYASRTDLADPQALYQRALGDLRAGRYALAESDFAAFVKKFPNHKLAGNAQYWLGESYYVRQQYKRAATSFLTGYERYRKNAKAPDSLLKLGMVLVALGDKKNACGAFADLLKQFPNASASVKRRAGIEKNRASCDG